MMMMLMQALEAEATMMMLMQALEAEATMMMLMQALEAEAMIMMMLKLRRSSLLMLEHLPWLHPHSSPPPCKFVWRVLLSRGRLSHHVAERCLLTCPHLL